MSIRTGGFKNSSVKQKGKIESKNKRIAAHDFFTQSASTIA